MPINQPTKPINLVAVADRIRHALSLLGVHVKTSFEYPTDYSPARLIVQSIALPAIRSADDPFQDMLPATMPWTIALALRPEDTDERVLEHFVYQFSKLLQKGFDVAAPDHYRDEASRTLWLRCPRCASDVAWPDDLHHSTPNPRSSAFCRQCGHAIPLPI